MAVRKRPHPNVPRARTLRRDSTDAERAMWRLLRSRQLAGYKFRRQLPIGPYIADFACFASRLVVELDGGQHGVEVERDTVRTRVLGATAIGSYGSGTPTFCKTRKAC
jgi:very-short-patch-repair endonuclease